MMEFTLLSLAVVAVSTILGVGAIVLFSLLYVFGKRTPNLIKDSNFTPSVSIVIPTRNEKMIIEERLKNIISMDYPSEMLEVIFVDDSNDGTQDVISAYKTKYPYIKLLKQEKPGFNNALNQGYSSATGDIVIKSDCDAFPLPDALRKIVANFADNRVGAVSGICHFDSSDKRMEKLFREIQTRFKQTEAYLHSALIFLGGFGAYRKNLIPQLPEEITADDSELVINVVKKGYRAIIDPSVKVKFPSPENFSERRSQLDRRAGGVMRVIFQNIRMLFNPKYGKFGLITLPMEFFLLIAAPILLLIDFALVLIFLSAYQPLVAVATVGAMCLFLLSTRFFVWSRTFLDTYISCIHGILISFTRKKTWKKEEEGRLELLKTR